MNTNSQIFPHKHNHTYMNIWLSILTLFIYKGNFPVSKMK